jgi:hypothetical protein
VSSNHYATALETGLARLDDADGLAGYLVANSRLPGPRGNLALAAAFANAMCGSAERSAWHPVLVGWAATPADVVPTNDPREFLPFCALFALGAEFIGAEERTRSEIAASLRAAASSGRWRTREAVAMGLQRIGESDPSALRVLVEQWMEDATLFEQRAIVAALAHPPILGDPSTLQLSLEASRRFVLGIRSLTPAARRTEEFRVLSKGLDYAISVFVAAAPADGFALLRELATIDDRDVHRIVRSNLGKSRLSRPYPTQVAEIWARLKP